MKLVTMPNLPQGRVEKALLSGQAEDIITGLENLGVGVIRVGECDSLERPVSSHADLQFHHLGGDMIAADTPGKAAAEALKKLGFTLIHTKKHVSSPFPGDVALDAARVGKRLICNPRFTDIVLLEHCASEGIEIINVKQGYAKCSVCVVDENSIITADIGIANAAESVGLSVLRISAGYICLPGHECGFIGGCCGKLAPDIMAFCGDLSTHPDHKSIDVFLRERGVFAESLCRGQLTDIGGIIPLAEG